MQVTSAAAVIAIGLVSVLCSRLAGVRAAGKNAHIPAGVPLCSLALPEPQLDECLRDSVQHIVPELVKGIPNLGVLSIDPFDIVEASIGATDGPVALSLNFKKLQIRGFNSAKITSVKYDPKAYRIEVRVKIIDPIRLDSKYKMDGKVLVLPIQGDGQCMLVLHNITAVLDLQGHEKVKHGDKYMEVDHLSVKFNTTRLQMQFENLFNGNKELGDNMNRFLNENWQILLQELGPSIEDTFGAAFQVVANRIFLKVPLSKIFLA